MRLTRSLPLHIRPTCLCKSQHQNTNLDVYIDQARARLASHPPKHIIDYLSPTPSHLLAQSLKAYIRPRIVGQPDSPSDKTQSCPSQKPQPPPPARPLPQGHHLVYFPLTDDPTLLLPDGTDPTHCPGAPFTRRMWAGGSVTFAPRWRSAFVVDPRHVRRVCCVETVGPPRLVPHLGQGDEKVYVNVRRVYTVHVDDGRDGPANSQPEEDSCIDETRTLVFMREVSKGGKRPGEDDDKAGPPKRRVIQAPLPLLSSPTTSLTLLPSPTLLFHFSALTYNAHSIHFDPLFARHKEGYPGLLVHGPLSLVLMLGALQLQDQDQQQPSKQKGDWWYGVRTLSYRNVAPLFADEEMHVRWRSAKNGSGAVSASSHSPLDDEEPENVVDRRSVWVEGPEGGLAVKGTAEMSWFK